MPFQRPWALIISAILAAILVACSFCPGQELDSTRSGVSRQKLRLVMVASSATYIAAMIGLNNLWYSQSPRSSFHFFNDINEWKQMDKVGHFYSAFQLASVSTSTFRWAGLSKSKSDRFAALTSLGIMASIEVMDGFSSAYGASLPDMAANILGGGFFLGKKCSGGNRGFTQNSLFTEPPLRQCGLTNWVQIYSSKLLAFHCWLPYCTSTL